MDNRCWMARKCPMVWKSIWVASFAVRPTISAAHPNKAGVIATDSKMSWLISAMRLSDASHNPLLSPSVPCSIIRVPGTWTTSRWHSKAAQTSLISCTSLCKVGLRLLPPLIM
jgi:hypothetical protein